MPDDHRAMRERLGAYVLGHLPPDEAAAVRAHLDGCAECRAEERELAPVAQRLALGSPQEASALPAPPRDLGERVVARVARERRSHRRARRLGALRLSGAGALVGGSLAAAAFALWPSGDQDPAPARQPARVAPAGEVVAFRSLPPGVKMRATVTPRAWGTSIAVNVEGVPAGIRCTVWLRRADGTRVSAGSFRYVDRKRGSRVLLASSLPRSEAVAVGLKAGRWTYAAPLR